MSINFYSVQNHLLDQGWVLISTNYKNLNTELEMKCPEGHTQFKTYGQWRKNPVCEICLAGDPYKIKNNKLPAKSIDTYRILALDAATKITGYAVYDNDELVYYGVYKVNDTIETTERINQIKYWLEAVLKEWKPDYVGVENIQLQTLGTHGAYQVETYRVLANLQGVLMDTLFENNIPHTLVYSSEWRKYCGVSDGNGRENKKKQAQDKVALWYNKKCTQDEADAICLGKYICFKNKKPTWGEDIE